MKFLFLFIAASLFFSNCTPNTASALSTDTRGLSNAPNLSQLFIDLPDDIWQGLPRHLYYLKDRKTREKLSNCKEVGRCPEGSIQINKHSLQVDLARPKGMDFSEEDKEGYLVGYNVYQLLLDAFPRNDGHWVVFIGINYQHEITGDYNYMDSLVVFHQEFRLFDLETNTWGPVIQPTTKPLAQLTPNNCRWRRYWEYYPEDDLMKLEHDPMICECAGALLEQEIFIWNGQTFDQKTEQIPFDTYSKY